MLCSLFPSLDPNVLCCVSSHVVELDRYVFLDFVFDLLFLSHIITIMEFMQFEKRRTCGNSTDHERPCHVCEIDNRQKRKMLLP